MVEFRKPHLMLKGGVWQACYGYPRGSKYRSYIILVEASTPAAAIKRYWKKLGGEHG